jgi:hypothetical protein
MAMVLHGARAGGRSLATGYSVDRGTDCLGTVHRIFVSAYLQIAGGGYIDTMTSLQKAGLFLRKARKKIRVGELSREPAKLLRIEWRDDCVECDWLMRPSDRWDADLPLHLAKENETLQSLRDALTLRKMIFNSFPSVMKAELRMFRVDSKGEFELMMTGGVARTNEVVERVASVVMRARLCGFQFNLASGVLEGPSRPC